MDVDFPTSREAYRQHDPLDSSSSAREGWVPPPSSEDGDHEDDHISRYTSDTDGFMGWPSDHPNTPNTVEEDGNDDDDDNESPNSNQRDPTKSGDEASKASRDYFADSTTSRDDSTDQIATVTVDFPEDRRPFIGRADSKGSFVSGASSGYNAGGSHPNTGSVGRVDDDDDGESISTENSSVVIRSTNSSMGGMASMLRQSSRSSMKSTGSATRGFHSSGDMAVQIQRQSSRSSVHSMGNASGGASSPGKRNGNHLRRSTNSRASISSGEGGGGGGSSRSMESRQSLREALLSKQSSSKSLRKSLAKQSSSRRSMVHPSDASSDGGGLLERPALERKPSLGELHDENVNDLPILGWDKDVDEDSSLGSSAAQSRNSFAPAQLVRKGGGKSKSAHSSSSFDESGEFGPGPLPNITMSLQASMARSISSRSYASSMRASQQDHDIGGMVYEDFGTRHQRGGHNAMFSSLDREDSGNAGNRYLLTMMMEEEYDPRKPWRKAPPDSKEGGAGGAGAFAKKNKLKQQKLSDDNLGGDRRVSYMTSRTSYTSDMSLGEIYQGLAMAPSPPATGGAPSAKDDGDSTASDLAGKDGEGGDPLPSQMEDEEEMTAASTARRHGPSDGDSAFCNSRRSNGTSALSDDDNSELTELRLAQELLFSVPESVSVSTARDDDSSVHSISSITRKLQDLRVSTSSADGAMRSKDLSSLDIVQEEQTQYHKKSENKDEEAQLLFTVEENDGSEREGKDPILGTHSSRDQLALDELPTSSLKKNAGKGNSKEDDSMSYSDIDPEPAAPPPSIKTCMTVRNSMLEREFATETLTDVEFGETKPDQEMTLGMFLDPGGERNDADDELYHPMMIDDRDNDAVNALQRNNLDDSDNYSSYRTSSTRKSIKKSVISQTAKLDTKAAKKLRRKNKRLWKFCVWNCRKITIAIVIGLCVLAGIAAFAWWGATKVTGGGGDNTEDTNNRVDSSSDVEESMAPAGSESKPWPPVTESGREPPPSPTQLPSSMPSSLPLLSGNSSDLATEAPLSDTSSSQSYTPSISPSSTKYSVPSSIVDKPTVLPPVYDVGGTLSPSFVSSPAAPPLATSTFNYTSNPMDSYPGEQSTTPSSAPSIPSQNISIYPGSSPSSYNSSFIQSPPMGSESAASIYPSWSPSTNLSSSDSASPLGNATAVEPTLNNTYLFEAPSTNVTGEAAMNQSISSNASAFEDQLANFSSVTPVDPSSLGSETSENSISFLNSSALPSNNASSFEIVSNNISSIEDLHLSSNSSAVQSSNASFIETFPANSTALLNASALLSSNLSSFESVLNNASNIEGLSNNTSDVQSTNASSIETLELSSTAFLNSSALISSNASFEPMSSNISSAEDLFVNSTSAALANSLVGIEQSPPMNSSFFPPSMNSSLTSSVIKNKRVRQHVRRRDWG